MSRIRANQITNQSADGAPTVQNGLVISGVTTSTTFSGSGANLTSLPAANITGTLPAISGANLTNLDASDLASGTVPTARLGSGTASSSTFLAGDSTYKTVTGTTINNNANNRIITGSGTANTLEGESTITYDNPTLEINTDTSPYAGLTLNGNSGGLIQFEDNEVSKWQIFGDSALNFYDDVNINLNNEDWKKLESLKEIRLIKWPSKKETFQTTMMICLVVFVMGLILCLVDMLFFNFIKWVAKIVLAISNS